MKPPRHIRVFPQDIKPGAKYRGYVCGNSTHFCEVTITEDGTPLIFGKYPIEEKVDYFQRDLTWDEEQEWYKNNIDMTNPRNQLNLMGLHNQMYSVGDASHEMWNAWIEYNWVEQLMEIVDEDFFIIGIAPPPWGCRAIDDPVAVVAEYDETGERFWCHAHKYLVEKMIDDTKDIYEKLINFRR